MFVFLSFCPSDAVCWERKMAVCEYPKMKMQTYVIFIFGNSLHFTHRSSKYTSSSLSTQRSHHVHKLPQRKITDNLHLHFRKFVTTLKNIPFFQPFFGCNFLLSSPEFILACEICQKLHSIWSIWAPRAPFVIYTPIYGVATLISIPR